MEKRIDKLRLSAEGMGETNLLNRCKDGADCSEEEHRKNQRAVFKVSWKE
ncbi:hypothetical protein JYU20_04545 [Bacteroidales bacterium AH-315-I05]|nr:hypothetical protein [Bacteroidales bacterium AH-315-I05]